MSQFYSSLVINSKNFPKVHQVFKPRYNKEFFKRVTGNIEALEQQIEKRLSHLPPDDRFRHAFSSQDLKKLKDESRKLLQLKDKFERLARKANQDESGATSQEAFQEITSQINEIEDRIMPLTLSLPNRSSKLVPESDTVISEIKQKFLDKANLFKVLDYRKLSFINNCYSKSIVGPNSHYYFGVGAKTQQALSNYFMHQLESVNFIPVSGLCLTKSAVVEASNSIDGKQYSNDPCRIVKDEPSCTTSHLVEASRESLVSLVTTFESHSGNEPVRFVTSGAGYSLGLEWFDGDETRVSQSETVHALILNSSIEHYSMQEYVRLRDLIWNIYEKLELPIRLVHCSLASMLFNEYDAHRIDVWIPSRHDWVPVGRVSHYLDYITVRTGMKRGHLIDSSVYDGRIMTAALMENRQTSSGSFILPTVLQEHAFFDDQETARHFRNTNSSPSQNINPKPMFNYEQRRYLTKKNYFLGHSRKAKEFIRRRGMYRDVRIFIAVACICAQFVDWTEFWYGYLPTFMQEFLYDYVFRPARRIWWWCVYTDPSRKPADLTFSEIDKTEYNRTMYDRRKEMMLSAREGERTLTKT